MFGHGGVAPIGRAAHMNSHPPVFVEDLYGAVGDAGPELLLGQDMGHGIVMFGNLHMVIETGAALLPFGILVGLRRQWL